jgi:hypothetical protein
MAHQPLLTLLQTVLHINAGDYKKKKFTQENEKLRGSNLRQQL